MKCGKYNQTASREDKYAKKAEIEQQYDSDHK